MVKNTKNYKKGKSKSKSFEKKVKAVLMKESEPKKIQDSTNEQLMTTIDVNPTVIDIPLNVPLGTQNYQRVGNEVTATGIRTRFLIHNTATSTDSICYVRFSVLEVRQGRANNNSDVTGQLYDPEASGNDVAYTGGLASLLRDYNREQLRVLKDEVLFINKGNATNPVIMIDRYFDLKGKKIVYTDGATDQPQNKRYIVIMIPLQVNADEDTGTVLEYSYVNTFYYKDV